MRTLKVPVSHQTVPMLAVHPVSHQTVPMLAAPPVSHQTVPMLAVHHVSHQTVPMLAQVTSWLVDGSGEIEDRLALSALADLGRMVGRA